MKTRPPLPLPQAQRQTVDTLVDELSTIAGIDAVALGGSHARGFARPDSDIDLGIFYSEARPFSIPDLRELAQRHNDSPSPAVTDFHGWGYWVNGGAWLTIGRQRVDLLYRSYEQLERVIADAEQGRYASDYGQQPPFGFFGPTYLGELRAAVPLLDRRERLESLKARVTIYPEALRRAIIQHELRAVQFGISAFARKFAARADSYLTIASLVRFIHQLTLAIFALNRSYPVNDKTVLAEVEAFPAAPTDFRTRVESLLDDVGREAEPLQAAVRALEGLFAETAALAGDLYRPGPLP